MAADAGVSLGVVLAGVAIILTGWQWLDPAVSLIIVVVIFVGTWGLLRDSVNLALDAVPEGIDSAAVGAYLAALPGVIEVHDLHIWAMSTTETALTAHLVIPRGGDGDTLLGAYRRGTARAFRHRPSHHPDRARRSGRPLRTGRRRRDLSARPIERGTIRGGR